MRELSAFIAGVVLLGVGAYNLFLTIAFASTLPRELPEQTRWAVLLRRLGGLEALASIAAMILCILLGARLCWWAITSRRRLPADTSQAPTMPP